MDLRHMDLSVELKLNENNDFQKNKYFIPGGGVVPV